MFDAIYTLEEFLARQQRLPPQPTLNLSNIDFSKETAKQIQKCANHLENNAGKPENFQRRQDISLHNTGLYKISSELVCKLQPLFDAIRRISLNHPVELSLSNNYLGKCPEILEMLTPLIQNGRIEDLEFYGNVLGESHSDFYTTILRFLITTINSPFIRKFHCGDNQLYKILSYPENLEQFSNAVATSSLKELNIAFNDLWKLEANLKRIIFSHHLEKLNLNGNGLGNYSFGGVEYIIQIVKSSFLRELSLYGNELGLFDSDEFKRVFEEINKTKKLEVLNLRSNLIGFSIDDDPDLTLVEVFENFARTTCLREFMCDKNRFSTANMQRINEAILQRQNESTGINVPETSSSKTGATFFDQHSSCSQEDIKKRNKNKSCGYNLKVPTEIKVRN